MSPSDFNDASRPSPLVARALSLIAGEAGGAGAIAPESLNRISRAHTLIDQYIDAPENERDALKVVTVLLAGSPDLHDNVALTEATFGADTANVLREMNTVQNLPRAQQVQSIRALVECMDMLESLRHPERQVEVIGRDPGYIIEHVETACAYWEMRSRYAQMPRLEDAVRENGQQLLQAIRAAVASPKGSKPVPRP